MNENGRWFSSTNYEPACKQLGTIGNSRPVSARPGCCVCGQPVKFMEFSTPDDMSSFNWEG